MQVFILDIDVSPDLNKQNFVAIGTAIQHVPGPYGDPMGLLLYLHANFSHITSTQA